jgi:hypothetical protein
MEEVEGRSGEEEKPGRQEEKRGSLQSIEHGPGASASLRQTSELPMDMPRERAGSPPKPMGSRSYSLRSYSLSSMRSR